MTAIDESREQHQQELPADALALCLGRDIERIDLAAIAQAAVALRPAIAEADDALLAAARMRLLRHPDVAGAAAQEPGPGRGLPLLRHAEQHPVRQHAGIGRAPRLDLDAADGSRILESRLPDSAHVSSAPAYHRPASSRLTRRRWPRGVAAHELNRRRSRRSSSR